MKKPNINLNVDAIKEWGLEHGEKIAFGVVGAIFFFSLFKFVTVKPYDKNPAALNNATRKAEKNLGEPDSWANSGEAKNFVNLDYDVQAKKLTTPTNVADYVWDIPMWDELEVGGGRVREPKFLTLLEPIASPGKGAFEIKEDKDEDRGRGGRDRKSRAREDRDADEEDADDDRRNRRPRKKIEGFRWVAVRAVVPVGLQRAEFVEALNLPGSGAPNAEPDYTNVVFHRRQLTTSNTWSEWEEVDPRAAVQAMSRIQLGGKEVVASSQTGQFTARLPTLEGREWTVREMSHPRLESRDPEEEDETAAEEDMVQPEAGELDRFGRLVGQRGQRGRDAANALNRRNAARLQRLQRGRGARANLEDEVWLFRIFDFTVEPGHCYQYRVQLVLKNPNYNRPAREVRPIAGAELQPNEGEVRETSWSKETAPVCVAPDVTYYVDQFNERGRADGGNVQIDLVRWDKDSGKFESQAMTLNKGQVISSKGRMEISTSDFVVDFTGGLLRLSQIPDSEEFLPAEMLVANESGELIVRTERADDEAHSIIQFKTKRRGRDAEEEEEEEEGGNPNRFSFGDAGN